MFDPTTLNQGPSSLTASNPASSSVSVHSIDLARNDLSSISPRQETILHPDSLTSDLSSTALESVFSEHNDLDEKTPKLIKQAKALAYFDTNTSEIIPAKHENSIKDPLTGLPTTDSIANSQDSGKITSAYQYNSTYGHGLVNASTAVAWAHPWYPYRRFNEVRNLGGVNIGNDIVKAPEVWAQSITGRGVTIAVIDSGVDIFHPNLSSNAWRNAYEIAGDGVDNDRNGYIDDIYGWNFGAQNNNILDTNGHGTHVAGTIAANGLHTTGVAPHAKIMALKLGDADSQGRFINAGNLAEAIRYAVDNGAQVINMSLGWSDSNELASALAYAASHNVITVSAAGNQGEASPGTPAYYSTHYGLSVGAIDYSGRIANFSNRAGSDWRMQHLVAPGVDIYSTLPGDRYGLKNGTSMAAPHVSGVVALMLSANLYLTHAQVRSILTNSATYLGGYNQQFATSDRSVGNMALDIGDIFKSNTRALDETNIELASKALSNCQGYKLVSSMIVQTTEVDENTVEPDDKQGDLMILHDAFDNQSDPVAIKGLASVSSSVNLQHNIYDEITFNGVLDSPLVQDLYLEAIA
ncbi:MAG: S8 family peptidase [Elainellaceae cyanobacterium]